MQEIAFPGFLMSKFSGGGGGGGMPPDSPTRRGQRPLTVIAAYLCPNTRLLPKIMKSFSVMEFNV